MVSDELCATIFEADMKLKTEIEESKVSAKVKKVTDLYEKRIKLIQQFKEEHKDFNKHRFASIALSFEKDPKGNNDFWHLGKWFIFDQCYREALESEENMLSLKDDDMLRTKLAQAISSGGDNYPKSFSISEEESVKISQITEKYKDDLITAIIT